MTREQALYNFWAGFGIPAYDEGSVPDETELPYITYNVSLDNFEYPVSSTASIWDESTSWVSISQKCSQIESEISRGGKMISFDNGAFWIKKGHPFAQRVNDPNEKIRRILINVEIEYIV